MTSNSEHTGVIESIDSIGSGLIKIAIGLKNDQTLEFKAGQYLAIPIPGMDKTSYYSIASPPTLKNKIELIVKEDKQGIGAGYLFSLSPGDSIAFNAPYGKAYLREDSQHNIVFVAGSSGASYVRSMLHYLHDRNSLHHRTIHYFFGVQTEAELCELDYWHDLAEQYTGFHFVPVLSSPDNANSWLGESGLVTNAVDRILHEPLEGWDAYTAGSPAMVRVLADLLISKKGLPADRFFSDMHPTETPGIQVALWA